MLLAKLTVFPKKGNILAEAGFLQEHSWACEVRSTVWYLGELSEWFVTACNCVATPEL